MALQDKKIMPPPWLAHREIERYSIGWRMGYGEDYIDRFGDWLDTLPIWRLAGHPLTRGTDGIPHSLSRAGDLEGLVG